MNGRLDIDPLAARLAAAMADRAAAIEAPLSFIADAQDRATTQRRNQFAVLGVAVSVVLVVVAAAAVAGLGRGASLRPPAASGQTATPQHSRYEPTVLPRGFDPMPYTRRSDQFPPEDDGSIIYVESAYYHRGYDPQKHRAAAYLQVDVTSGAVEPITLAYYAGKEPAARAVVLRGTTVVHVRNMLGENGLDIYEWTEAPGINISVNGRGDVTDAEVREFVTALSRVDDAPTSSNSASAAQDATKPPYPRMETITLPAGFSRFHSYGQPMRFADNVTMGRLERVTYRRGSATIAIVTISGENDPVELADFKDSALRARWVQIGSRRVVHVSNSLATPGGPDNYGWTEKPGVNVMVTGQGDLTDAEVRTVIEGVHLVHVNDDN